ncbi:hypothetical protein BDP27DRAFT_1426007 [Rhodocollybia butyracea]|uniref:Uncharacterized protein n=1 Tax=Rhodocollybia butyracea TaxID=206335 RepID=A0A9P5PLQ2_9AGAR|nr:hypothetical protein BDP27DRAFT_1426007 [Rhodocollybia butyracea]
MKDGLGEGRVDYLCMTRRWVIELMREGDKRADHLARFKKDGAYCRAWKDWDWRVVDFYFETEPTSKALEEPNYRAVLLRRVEQALKITIKGLGIAEVTWDVYG